MIMEVNDTGSKPLPCDKTPTDIISVGVCDRSRLAAIMIAAAM